MNEEGRSGRTTRIANDIVQRFFTEPKFTPILIVDHPGGNNIKLAYIIINRLKNEHGLVLDSDFLYIKKHIAIMRISDNRKEKLLENSLKVWKSCIDDNEEELETLHFMSMVDLSYRATGRSTRQIDAIIEDFLNPKTRETMVYDVGCPSDRSTMANTRILGDVVGRLKEEHPTVRFRIIRGRIPSIIKINEIDEYKGN